MATLYVENVPDELYTALRDRARQHRKSLAAEVISLLEDSVPTAAELKRRKHFLHRVQRLGSRQARSSGPFPSTEQMLREDRAR
jgi:plasmid stability protein